ncbi:MAG: class III extradiol ring-cleavage dioxygenase [Planctomycetota bacterium]
MTNTERTPVAFVSHGAPTLAVDPARGADLAAMGAELGAAPAAPRAVLVVSAHWERAPATIGTTTARELLHDYGGFPREIREVRYDAPAAPDVAARVADLVRGVERDERRPWDHGVWVPLVHMFPRRDVPVVQLSLPSRSSGAELVELGRRLAPLRDEGVLVLGSGGAVHNLGAIDWTEASPPPSWATEFESFARAALDRGDLDALADAERRAPAFRRAHPSAEHWQPLLVAAGAGAAASAPPTYPVEGFEYGSLSRLAVRWG